MGIEAFCPNGHRMKVKDHLAGRLGVCPMCGSRFRLPDISNQPPPRQPVPIGTIPAAPIGTIPAVPDTAPLPVAEPLPIDPAVASSLPIAVPYPGPVPPFDPPPFAIPTVGTPTAVTFGQGPPPINPPGDFSQADPLLDWAASPQTPRFPRKRPRNDGGIGLSLALAAIAATAAALAWMVLRSRGIG